MNPSAKRLGFTTLLMVGCASGMKGPEMPAPLVASSSSEAASWVATTERRQSMRLQFHWDFLDARGAASGNGAATIAPPDSLRFDFSGPLGSGRGAAAVIGDRQLWAKPEDEVRKLVPSYPILWALLGQARYPAAGDVVSRYVGPQTVAWQYVSGVDTVDYILVVSDRRLLVADVRQAGRRIGRVVTSFDTAGHPLKARLDVPSAPARLTLDFTRVRLLDSVPDSLWVEPIDEP